ncbi:MAG: hypothetical protein ABFC57_02295, partial [Veillonellales bacterium]
MEQNNLQVHENEVAFLKAYFNMISHSFEDGACFFTTDLEKVTYKQAEIFDMQGLDVGTQFSQRGIAAQAIQSRQVVTQDLDRNIYGIRVHAVGGPVWNENDSEIVGAWALTTPRQHKLVNAFEAFAPIITESLPEGGFICITDREKCIKRQGSAKFDMTEIQVGESIRDGSCLAETLKQKKQVMIDVDAAVFGFPVRTVGVPLVDDTTDEIVGTFNIGIPRKLATDLKELAQNLDQGLTGVAAA